MATNASRKRRGRDTEHMVAKAFADDGWPYALATGAGAAGRDVTGVPGICVEVKARNGFEPMANLRQVCGNATTGEVPVVIMRPNGMGPASIDAWPAFLPFGVLRLLLRQAGYGDPVDDTEEVPRE